MKALAFRALQSLCRFVLLILSRINNDLYMHLFTRFLKMIGVRIVGIPKYIAPDVYLDSSDYSLIELGDNVVVSREVMFLTHDYSLACGLASVGRATRRGDREVFALKSIRIGTQSFIGARVSLLPGADIGDHVVIGAGAVVAGHIPSGSVAAGNPCRVIARTQDWALRKERNDSSKEKIK